MSQVSALPQIDGLTPETVKAAGLRHISAEKVSEIVGFRVQSGGLLIPYGENGVCRVRLDKPHQAPGWDKPAKYLTPRGARNHLYISPTLSKSLLNDVNTPLILTEGEKRALCAVQHGFACIAVAGIYAWLEGEGKGELSDAQRIIPDFDKISWRKRRVYLVYDSDITPDHKGYAAFQRLARVLEGVGAIARVLTLPDVLSEGKTGLDDYLMHRSPDELKHWLENSASSKEIHEKTEKATALDPAALHGLAGQVVSEVEPYTEADSVGLLMSFLVAVGTLLDNKFSWSISGVQHTVRIWAVLVGLTSKGRKGTSWGPIHQICKAAVPDWNERTSSGLSSGEGLIWAVRDPIFRNEKVTEGKGAAKNITYVEVMVDAGISDKRLLVRESEFGGTLKVAHREGNTLSNILRQGWEIGRGDMLQTLTKNSQARSTGPHIGILAHITRDELMRYLEDTETANGFANRFIWVTVKRSKVLPFGADVPGATITDLSGKLSTVLGWAKEEPPTVFTWTPAGAEAWARVYPDLSEGYPGLVGAVLGRAEAQVLRLAGLYALLDMRTQVDAVHLEAALALWDFADECAKGIFGERYGDPVADAIWEAVGKSDTGLTQTDVNKLFSGNTSAARIGSATARLIKEGRITTGQKDTGGRPVTVYRRNGKGV